MSDTAGLMHTDVFPPAWRASILAAAPPILPARRFVLPRNVPGEEEALARGAMWIHVQQAHAAAFSVQCARGFAGSGVAHGVWSAPEPDELWAVAGGYAYCIPCAQPEQAQLLPLRPVVQVLPSQEAGVLVLAGFTDVWVRGRGDVLWQSPRLSWEGVTLSHVEGGRLYGTGWHMRTDRELPFALDLETRELTGGGYLP